ncbi:hypothetical protein PDE01_44960 [Paracoccus denitrificans]|nr:hypothetical protein PDE01_44960 [Paracoccus denitrificans]
MIGFGQVERRDLALFMIADEDAVKRHVLMIVVMVLRETRAGQGQGKGAGAREMSEHGKSP